MLVTVKTSPQPSEKYRDTVCVAGIRVDEGHGEWVRLYPIPFRWIGSEQKFRKYDIVELNIRRRTADSRLESFTPDMDSLVIQERIDKWKDRAPLVNRVPRTTVCELSRAAAERHNAPSLGLIDVEDLSAIRHSGWSDRDRERIAAAMRMPVEDLFGARLQAPPALTAPRFKVSYRFRCTARGCTGHNGQILDWELTELQRRFENTVDDELQRAVRHAFVDRMFSNGKQTSFFMGNFEDPVKRHAFSVLGIYYPDRTAADRLSLF